MADSFCRQRKKIHKLKFIFLLSKDFKRPCCHLSKDYKEMNAVKKRKNFLFKKI